MIGKGSVIAAGALVTQGTVVPPRSLVVGLPGKILKEDDASLEEYAIRNAQTYVQLAARYKNGDFQQY